MMTKLSVVVAASVVLLAASARAQDMATVHIDGKGTLAQNGQVVCEAPCDVAVPRWAKYVVVDDMASKPFVLPHEGNVLLHVDHRQKSYVVVGGVVLAASLVFAGVFLALAATSHTNCAGQILCIDPVPFYLVTAGVIGGGGAATGIALMAIPPTTITSVHVERAQGAMPALGARWGVRF